MAQERTPAHVAATATVEADINLRDIVLLGTMGTESAPEALIRLPNGETAKVAPGSKVGNETVATIDDGRVALSRGGTAHWLEIPGS
ncbi:amidophosphoribosyltransferase [Litorisediminicola beolgyonensis]|uniref:Amidophosphoribosyltransferase n=1 Tax=Litorisediminicola beolgyonensis TaxID=1173614 RepID=A0ABW3ZFA4_9RHOB